ncbi:tripartite tricarboxylate transporter substrate binding protein [Arthrobacter pigmenti]
MLRTFRRTDSNRSPNIRRGARFAGAATVAMLALTGCGSASGGSGEDYPTQPINFSVGSEPGSGWDATARALTESMEKEDTVPVQVNVQNRPGAIGCVLLNSMVNDMAGDPNEIAMTSTPLFTFQLRGQCEIGYEDITMIARVLTSNFLVAVPSGSQYSDLGSLLDAIIANPQSVPIAAAGDDQLPLALLVKAAGGDPAKINFIEFESGGEYITAMLNGDVKASVSGVTEFGAQIKAGDFEALAVLSEERLEPPLDNIPTAQEQGYDVVIGGWRGVYGPPDMPDYAVKYWQKTLQETLKTDTWKEIAERNQWTTAYMDGKELESFMEEEYGKMKEALQSIGAAK